MERGELKELCRRVSTWDQSEIDSLLGEPAIQYAEMQERDVRRLANEMWGVFPFGPRWWQIRRALIDCRYKAAAIKVRAAQIAEGRKTGLIVERWGCLVYADTTRF
jgi:hypothetical protein